MPDHYDGPEYRTVTDIRAAGDDTEQGRTLEVTFARFGEWNEIYSPWEGRFLERLEPGAFADTFAERGDRIRCLFNHGRDPSIGDKPLGQVVSLEETARGPHAVVELLDRSYVDDVRAGLMCTPPLYGASYRFRVVAESWDDDPGVSDHNPAGIPERTISRVNVAEFGPVTFPADEATNQMIGVRSLTDRFAPPKDREYGKPEHPQGAGPDTERATIVTAFAFAQRRRALARNQPKSRTIRKVTK